MRNFRILHTIAILLITVNVFAQVNDSIQYQIENYQFQQLENGLKVQVINTKNFDHIYYRISVNPPILNEKDMIGIFEILAQIMGADIENQNMLVKSMVSHPLAADSLLNFLADVLLKPNINPDILEKIINSKIQIIENNSKNEFFTRNQQALQLIFGPQHPLAVFPTELSLKKITAPELTRFHSEICTPQATTITIVGNITINSIIPLVQKYFGSWSGFKLTANQKGKIEIPEPRIYYIKTNTASSLITFRNLSNTKLYPNNYIPTQLYYNMVFSHKYGKLKRGFPDRYSYITQTQTTPLISDDLFSISYQFNCNNENVEKTTNELISMLVSIKNEAIDPEIYNTAQTEMVNDFEKSLKKPSYVALNAFNLNNAKLKNDFYTHFSSKINAVGSTQIQSIAPQLISDKNFIILISGPEEALYCQLALLAQNYEIVFLNEKLEQQKTLPKGFGTYYIINKYLSECGINNQLKQATFYYDGIYFYPDQKIRVQGQILRDFPDKYKFINNVVPGKDTLVFHYMEIFDGKKGLDSTMFSHTILSNDQLMILKQKAFFYPELYYNQLQYSPKYECIYQLDTAGINKVNITDVFNNKTTDYYNSKTGYKIKTEVLDTENKIKTQYLFENYAQATDNAKFYAPLKIIEINSDLKIELKINSIDTKTKIKKSEFKIK